MVLGSVKNVPETTKEGLTNFTHEQKRTTVLDHEHRGRVSRKVGDAKNISGDIGKIQCHRPIVELDF